MINISNLLLSPSKEDKMTRKIQHQAYFDGCTSQSHEWQQKVKDCDVLMSYPKELRLSKMSIYFTSGKKNLNQSYQSSPRHTNLIQFPSPCHNELSHSLNCSFNRLSNIVIHCYWGKLTGRKKKLYELVGDELMLCGISNNWPPQTWIIYWNIIRQVLHIRSTKWTGSESIRSIKF